MTKKSEHAKVLLDPKIPDSIFNGHTKHPEHAKAYVASQRLIDETDPSRQVLSTPELIWERVKKFTRSALQTIFNPTSER